MRRIASSVIGASLALALASAVVVLTPSPALSQAYPPACNVLNGAQDLGNIAPGQTFTFQLAPQCTFTPGATVNMTANGVAFTKVANASGFVTVTIKVISETAFEINPTVPARCGVNTITGTGPSTVAGGRAVTQTATFNLVCKGGVVARPPIAVTGRLSLTGANVTRWAAGALVLLLMGAALVTLGRRRSSART